MTVHNSSFRDPSGYVFTEGNSIKRSIGPLYFKQYKALTSGGFYKKLMDHGLLIPHEERANDADKIIIEPVKIPFISYPYEWSFSQYQHAALLTLKIQKLCLRYGFTLKDASAFNITFYKGKPVFIDTLSFDFYIEDAPWNAYRQFLTHFLAPLVLAKYHGAGFLRIMSHYMDGIPLTLASSLLPFTTRLNLFLYSNIHLPAKYESKYEEKTTATSGIKKLSKKAQLKMIDNLYHHIKKLKPTGKTEWADYYDKTNYDKEAFAEKAAIAGSWVASTDAKTIIDIGGNNGFFSRQLPPEDKRILVTDIDPLAVDENYRQVLRNKEAHIIPMVVDILNPSPAIGFENTERASFLERLHDLQPDLCLALAVIHHISLSGNVPFSRSAALFASFSRYLLLEFPSEEDSQVQFLLNRKGAFKQHFSFYTAAAFEDAYGEFFSIIQQKRIKNTYRTLYLLKNKSAL